MKKILIKNMHIIIMLSPTMLYQTFFILYLNYNLNYNWFIFVNQTMYVATLLSFIFLNTFIEFELNGDFEVTKFKIVRKINTETLFKNLVLFITLYVTYLVFSIIGVIIYVCIQLLFMVLNKENNSLNDILYTKMMKRYQKNKVSDQEVLTQSV